MVEQPTRGNNIIDLFATNRPSLVKHTKVIPGISDHEIVSVELTLSVTVNKPKVHNVYLWNRACGVRQNIRAINTHCSHIRHTRICT